MFFSLPWSPQSQQAHQTGDMGDMLGTVTKYPLVNVYITIQNHQVSWKKTTILMAIFISNLLFYQRVILIVIGWTLCNMLEFYNPWLLIYPPLICNKPAKDLAHDWTTTVYCNMFAAYPTAGLSFQKYRNILEAGETSVIFGYIYIYLYLYI